MELTTAVARGRGAVLGLAVLAAALGLWEVFAQREGSFLIPPMSEVVERSWHIWPSRDFLADVGASLKRLAAGYAFGAAVGIGVGLVMGSWRSVRRTLEPLVDFLRSVPPIAIVPAVIVILGLGDGMRVTVIAFAVCFPVLVNSIDGVRAVSPEARDTAAMLHVGPVERLFRIYLPSASPSIVAGLRVALSVGLVMVVISELVGGGDGLGHYIHFQQSQFAVPEMYSGLLFLALLGYVLNRLFLFAERRVLFWHFRTTP